MFRTGFRIAAGVILAAGTVGAARIAAAWALADPQTSSDIRAVTREETPKNLVPSWWTRRVREETLGGEEVRLVPGTATGDTAEAAVEAARKAAAGAATDLLLDALVRWLGTPPESARDRSPQPRAALWDIAAGRLGDARVMREASAEGRKVEHLTDGSKREGSYYRGWVMLRVPHRAFSFEEGLVKDAITRLRGEGNPSAAIALARALMAKNPGRFDRVRDLAELQRWAGRVEDSLASFRRAATLAPEESDRAALEPILRELEKEAAKDPWEAFTERLRKILRDHEDRTHVRIEPFEKEVAAGEMLLYTAWTSRPFTYWGLEVARDGVILEPLHDEESGTQLGDDRTSESFSLDAGTVLGGRLVVLLAAAAPRPWFHDAWIDRSAFHGDRSDETVARAIEEGRRMLDTLEQDLSAGRVHAAWMEFRIVP